MDKRLTYEVVLEPAEGGGFTVYVPSLKGCVSEGDTEEEALENIKHAVIQWLKTWEDIAAEKGGRLRRVEVTLRDRRPTCPIGGSLWHWKRPVS